MDYSLVPKDDYPITTSFPRTAVVTRLNSFAAEQDESAKWPLDLCITKSVAAREVVLMEQQLPLILSVLLQSKKGEAAHSLPLFQGCMVQDLSCAGAVHTVLGGGGGSFV
ncbi:hypothetical protein ACROYT_G018108 [Oculina patagonica]